jgi:23S rRNA pseudoU1915 N3-methylase RlmH
MPTMNARFNADFTSFSAAVAQADVELRGFDANIGDVSKSLSKMVDDFGGRQLIEQATLMADAVAKIGGASQLTDEQLARINATVSEASDKIARLGGEAPQSFQDITDAAKRLDDQDKSTGTSFTELVSSFVSAQAIIGALTTAWHTLIGFMEDSITAANDETAAQNKLNAALTAQGTFVPSVTKAYEDYAKSLQQTTTYSAVTITQTEAMLALVGGVMPLDMEHALHATTDLAAGLGVDLKTATEMVSRAAEGNITVLSRHGVELDKTRAAAEGFGYVLDQIDAKFGGQAATAAQTYAGRLAQLSNAWGDVESAVGKIITQNGTVLKAVSLVTEALNKYTTDLDFNRQTNNFVSDALIDLTQAMAFVIQSVTWLVGKFADFHVAGLQLEKDLLRTEKAFIDMADASLQVFRITDPVGWARTWSVASKDMEVESDRIAQKIKDLSTAQNDTAKTTDDWAKKNATMQAALADFGKQLEATRGQTVKLADASQQNANAWDNSTQPLAQNVKAQKDGQKQADLYAKALQGLTDAIGGPDGLNPATYEGIKYFLQYSQNTGDIARVMGTTAEAVKTVSDALKQSAKDADVLQNMRDRIAGPDGLDPAVVEAIKYFLEFGKSVEDIAKIMDVSKGAVQGVDDEVKVMAYIHQQTLGTIKIAYEQWSKSTTAALKTTNQAVADNLTATVDWQKKLGDLLDTSPIHKISETWKTELAKLDDPEHRMQENWQAAVDSLNAYFTEQIKEEKWKDALTTAGTGAATDFMSAFEGQLAQLPGLISSAIGGGNISQGFSNLGKTLAGNIGSDIGKSFATSGVGASIGSTISNAVAGGSTKAAGLFTNVIGGAISGVATLGISTAISLGATFIGKLFNDPEKQINPVREAFVQAAGGLDMLNQKAYAAGMTLNQLLQAKNADQYNAAIQALNDGFTQQATDLQLVTDTAAKYGFTLQELGPALQKQALDTQAQQLYKDWQVLNSAGLDTVAITTRMASSVSAYVDQAIAMGSDVPAAMEPMIDQMVKTGQLLDANGNAITDLGDAGVTFTMTMSQGFQALIASVKDLTTVISRSLGVALDDTRQQLLTMPTTLGVDVHYNDPGFTPSGGASVTGTEAQTVDVPGYATGTNGNFLDFGRGSLVMLHNKEAVVPQGQSVGSSDAAPGVTVIVNAQGAFFDTPDSMLRLADKVNEALTTKYGLTHPLRAA